jgi:hypothetical protein
MDLAPEYFESDWRSVGNNYSRFAETYNGETYWDHLQLTAMANNNADAGCCFRCNYHVALDDCVESEGAVHHKRCLSDL